MARKLAGDEKLTIAKMDATMNHPPKYFKFSGFPTIFWAGRGTKDQPEQYKGSRNLDGFLQALVNESDNRGTASVSEMTSYAISIFSFDFGMNKKLSGKVYTGASRLQAKDRSTRRR